MGDHVKRPLDDYVSRMVDSWQVSQPLHLRHLSIVRDTVLKGKTQIYVYYTYENFKSLVEGGTGFWEAVETVPSKVTIGKNVAAALNATPDVDEYGFPRLDENQFQGQENDATLEECVSALNIDPLHISVNDPVLRKLADGTYGKQQNCGSRFVPIDCDLGVRYKNHQQHSATIGNGPSPKKAAPAPSQALSTKRKVVERQKVALSTPSGAVSSKTQARETDQVAASKAPHLVPAKGAAAGSQNQRRQRLKNSGPKPRGRPRKHPKTGIPANFNTMTPDEVEDLVRSQGMYEKYEIIKVEKEIVRRIEDGEDAVVVAYEVLAERDASRKQEGELPLPKSSRAQILHNFAGEPIPEPDPDQEPAKPKGRHRKDIRYKPSMAAHTYFVPVLRKQAPPGPKGRDSEKGPTTIPGRTRRRGQRVLDQEVVIYLPSVAAHSWPHVCPPSPAVEVSTTDALQNDVKYKQGRLTQPKQPLDPVFEYMPSIAAHSGPFLPRHTFSIARAGQKRKRTTNIPLAVDEERATRALNKYLPSIAAHSGSFLPLDASHVVRAEKKQKRTTHKSSQNDKHNTTHINFSAAIQNDFTVPARESSLGSSNMQLNASIEGMYPGWEKFMLKSYQQQLGSIARPHSGLFVGKTTTRRKRPCEPRGFRPTHSKLAVFKSTRLSELELSVKRTTASEQIRRLGSRSQTPTSPVVESTPMPRTQSMVESQSGPSRSTLYPSPASSCLDSQPSQPLSANISPYADTAGTKRKRTGSPQPTRGVPPFDPFSASPHSEHSEHSSPTVGISNSANMPTTSLEIVASSPAVEQVHGDANVGNQASTRTPEGQADMNESRDSTPNASGFNDVQATPNEAAASQVLQPPQSCTRKAGEPSNRHPFGRINRQGGSAAMLRKSIIMEIVDKCEGVFPSHREMSSPFAAEWKRRGQEGTPEAKTISNAVNALIRENKLRQITFTSQTKQGLTVTKSMLTFPTIETTDPKVKETQTNMVAFHPRHFVPRAVLPPPDSQSAEVAENGTHGEKCSEKTAEERVQNSSAIEPTGLLRVELAKRIKDGKDRAAMARLNSLKDPDHQGFDDPGGVILPKHSGRKRGQKRVERLASIRKTKRSRIAPLPTIPADPVSTQSSLVWLPSKYAFSDFNFEEQRPSVLTAEAEMDMQTSTAEFRFPLDPSEQARQRIREIAENAARIERKQALVNSSKPSMLYTGLSLESPYAPVRPPSPRRKAPRSRKASLNTAGSRDQPLPNTPLYTRKAKKSRTVRRGDDVGLNTTALEEARQLPLEETRQLPLEETRQLPLISTTTRDDSMSTTASSSPALPLSHVSPGAAVDHAEGLGTPYQRALLVNFMDPVHYFHRATGTFSVTFLGLRPPRKIFAHRGTTLDPFGGSRKAVQPDSSHRRSTWLTSQRESQKTETTPFEKEVDDLLRRELEANESKDDILVGWPFVNHVFPHAHTTVEVVEADMEAAKQVTISLKDGRLVSRRFPRNQGTGVRARKSILSKDGSGIDPVAAGTRAPLKRRRLTSSLESRTQEEASEQVDLDLEVRPTKFRRIRGPREAKSLGENGEERLLTAVMVIRALTGGLDKHIDWVLVAKVFEPTYTQMFIHSRWSLTLQKYKLVLPKMESDFQSIFASAYEEGTVPALDYDNLDDYDWKWLVEWTMANVDTPTQSLPELPVGRSEFDGLYTLNKSSSTEINEFYEIDSSSVLARRTKIAHRDPYVLPLFQVRQGARQEDAEDFTTAKSWIRANIMTPESTYNSSVARAKLSMFPERMIEDALKQLLLDRVLAQENKGRLVPGRNYDVSDFLISRLKKNLQSAHFHRAAAYKQQLDHDFEQKGIAQYSSTADDGDMIVIVNLQAHQRITVVSIDVPMNKWGQTDGGYETRQMDKRRLNFTLELRPSPTYIYGNPLHPLPAPPSQHLQDPMARIPLWYDIHGSLVPVMWEMALAAVVAVLAVRPGVGASELEKAMRPALEVWELQQVLEWLVHAKAAKRVGQGFSVEDEWWWLALGTGESVEERTGEDGRNRSAGWKGKAKEVVGEETQDVIMMED